MVYDKDHVYFLGMDLQVKDGCVKFTMKEYLKDAVLAFGESINYSANTPGVRDLFIVDDHQIIKLKAFTIL